MMIIKGGETNDISYSCMYDAHNIIPDVTNEKDNLYGFYGFAHFNDNLDDTAPAVLLFDKDLNFVKGELYKCCANCTYVGRSGGGFFAECLCFGYQIDDEYDDCCEEFKWRNNYEEA